MLEVMLNTSAMPELHLYKQSVFVFPDRNNSCIEDKTLLREMRLQYEQSTQSDSYNYYKFKLEIHLYFRYTLYD